MSWLNRYPRRASKNDLRGKPLVVFADLEPTPSNVKGMKNLIVGVLDTGERWNILVTETDIDKILDCKGMFTFDNTQPWAEVIVR